MSTIYSDNSSTAKANPFTADATTGLWFFYAANGKYDVKFSGGGLSAPFTLGDIILQDNADTSIFTDGIVVTGQIGAGYARTDAQIEMRNAAGQHVMLSFYNVDATEEAATSYAGDLSNGTTKQQMVASFVRFVNSVNTFNNYKTVYAIHAVDSAGDKTPFNLFSNNSVKLLSGDTSGSPWATAPANNTLEIGSSTQNIGVDVYGVNRIAGATTLVLPSTGAGLELIYRLDGTHNESQISSYNRSTGLSKWMGLSGSLVRIDSSPDIATSVPLTGAGIELYYRTDGANDSGQIQTYNRATSLFKPLGIGATGLEMAAFGRFMSGDYLTGAYSPAGKSLSIYYNSVLDSGYIESVDYTTGNKPLAIQASNIDLITSATSSIRMYAVGRFMAQAVNLPSTGTSVEIYYKSTATATGVIRSYDRDTVAYKELIIEASKVAFNVNSGGDIQWGSPLIAMGGGAAPTLGTIGGSGPAVATQNSWMRVIDEGGTAFWVPAWK